MIGVLTIITVLWTDQTDLTYTLRYKLERYCRQIKVAYHRQYAVY
jgi:hypothetical protein